MFEVFIHKLYNSRSTKIETNCPIALESIKEYYYEYLVKGAQEYDILKIIGMNGIYSICIGAK